jgi:hypothetical protein
VAIVAAPPNYQLRVRRGIRERIPASLFGSGGDYLFSKTRSKLRTTKYQVVGTSIMLLLRASAQRLALPASRLECVIIEPRYWRLVRWTQCWKAVEVHQHGRFDQGDTNTQDFYRAKARKKTAVCTACIYRKSARRLLRRPVCGCMGHRCKHPEQKDSIHHLRHEQPGRCYPTW